MGPKGAVKDLRDILNQCPTVSQSAKGVITKGETTVQQHPHLSVTHRHTTTCSFVVETSNYTHTHTHNKKDNTHTHTLDWTRVKIKTQGTSSEVTFHMSHKSMEGHFFSGFYTKVLSFTKSGGGKGQQAGVNKEKKKETVFFSRYEFVSIFVFWFF